MQASYYIKALSMLPHPEGGYFKENYRSELQVKFTGFEEHRNVATSIFFLLEDGKFSALHRIKSDEIWHFYDGDPLEIIEISPEGTLTKTLLGRNITEDQKLVYCVKAGNWFGSRPATGSNFSLVGCTVAPGFDFVDFEMPNRDFFISHFPQHREIVFAMTRG
jgi:predicted cupin superfamily sugar epimerase